MPRIKNVNGVDIPFTQEEEDARDVEEAKWKAEKPMNDWVESIQLSDSTMLPRWMEDHIESEHSGIAGNPALQKRYDDKVALIATKPKE